jgi:hypothetical protein
MDEVEEMLITKSQYNALNEIRGLHLDAFHMVVAAKGYSNGYLLKGSTEAFAHLRADLSDEVYHELSPKSRLKHLRTLMYRLEPDAFD